MSRRLIALICGLTFLVGACSSDDDAEPATSATTTTTAAAGAGADGGLTLVAKNVTFDTEALTASLGTVVITIDNQDELPHNLHVTGPGDVDAKTDVENGPIVQTLEVTFGEAGTYEFICDVHPNMKGTISVS